MKNIILVTGLLTTSILFATPSLNTYMIAEYPFPKITKLNSCTTCHMPVVKDFLNTYGLMMRDKKVNGEINLKSLEQLDSDNDGKKNIDEIKNKSFPGSQADYPEYFVFNNTKGEVHFNHEMHIAATSYLSNGVCTSCHNNSLSTNPTGSNEQLFQKRFDDVISLRTEAHRICITCHKASGNEAAPVKCNDCHQ